MTASGAGLSAFRQARALALEQQRAAYEQQQDRHKRLTVAASKLKQASAEGSRYEGNDRDKLLRDFKRDRAGRSARRAAALEAHRDAEEAVERVVDRAPLRISIDPLGGGGGNAAIVLSGVALGYSATAALPLPPVSLRVDFGDCVAVVGPNGAGKSTLLRTMTGELAPLAGDVSVGRELRLGNLTQEHDSLSRELTPRRHIQALSGVHEFEAGQQCFRYGLTRRQVDCPIGQLNPGARVRVLLATFALRKVNALILDEPTNHLDEETSAELHSAAGEFHGTLVVVSHSRGFLGPLLERLEKDQRRVQVLLLRPGEVTQVESLGDYVGATQLAVDKAVAACFGSR